MEEDRASFSASLLTIFSLKEAVSIPLSLRSSIGSSSSFLPIPYNTAATCLHSTAQSGQEQENFIKQMQERYHMPAAIVRSVEEAVEFVSS